MKNLKECLIFSLISSSICLSCYGELGPARDISFRAKDQSWLWLL